MKPALHRALSIAFLLAVVAGMALTAISFLTARELIEHRGAYVQSVTPADSGMRYEVVPLQARDGTLLEGWWIPPKDGARRRDLAVVVLAHPEDGPWTKTRGTGKESMLAQAAALHRAGFIVLAFDFRSYGKSEGMETTGGWKERWDLAAAVRLARERAIGAPIAVYGERMGASAVVALGEEDSTLAVGLADGAYDSWWEGMSQIDSTGHDHSWWSSLSIPRLVQAIQSVEYGLSRHEQNLRAAVYGGGPSSRVVELQWQPASREADDKTYGGSGRDVVKLIEGRIVRRQEL